MGLGDVECTDKDSGPGLEDGSGVKSDGGDDPETLAVELGEVFGFCIDWDFVGLSNLMGSESDCERRNAVVTADTPRATRRRFVCRGRVA